MKIPRPLLSATGAICASLFSFAALADANKVVIGDIDDMSGLYADVIGPKAVEAIKMAIADFGGSALGQPIEVLTFDHQNKPDLGAQKFREWADRNGLTMLLGGSNTGVSLAMAPVAKEKKIPFIAIGAAGASLTGKDCTPYTVHYVYDTTALGNGTASTILNEGGKIVVLPDRGLRLRHAVAELGRARRHGKWRASRRLGARAAQHVGLLLVSLAGAEFGRSGALGSPTQAPISSNSLKAANEFGITKSMKPAALLAFISDINALGLDTAQGLYLTTAWYWDLNDKTRAFAKRFFDKTGVEPTMNQAGYYSATLTYLNAVKAAGTTDADKVMDELRKAKIDDMFTDNGVIRADGLMEHDMYVMQVKTPAESKYPWDYYRVVKKMSGEEAFGKLADSTCPLVKK